MTRPPITPDLLAATLAAAPARVRKRLDAAPAIAETWTWERSDATWLVIAGDERVRLPHTEPVTALTQVTCTCLLAPRCLHLLAVLTALPLAEAAPSPEDAPLPPSDETTNAVRAEQVELDDAQRAAAALAWEAGAALLATGAAHAGSAVRLRVLRAVHACRAAGLHRVAAAASAVAQAVQDLAAERPHFTLAGYADELAELLETAWRLGAGPEGGRPEVTAAEVGVGRRSHTGLAPTVLHGLFTEAVVTGSGYAGAVTYLADGDGRLLTVGDVLPGGQERVRAAYRAGVRFGGLSLSHEQLSRRRIFTQHAAASPDGRLSGGRTTTAASQGPSDWNAPPLDALWTTPLDAQLDRAWTSTDRLLFLDATVAGPGLLLETEYGLLRAVPPSDHTFSSCEENLRRLAATPGRRVRLIGRVLPARATVAALAVDGLNLAFDDLNGPMAPPFAPIGDDAPSPLRELRRILDRLALGGRTTAGPAATATVRRAASRLRRDHLPTAAALLDTLADRASEVRRGVTGQAVPAPPDRTARAWLAAMTYERHAALSLSRARWLPDRRDTS